MSTTPSAAGAPRPLALVTGASSGIGLELARQFAGRGYDLVVAAEDAELHTAAEDLRGAGTSVEAVQVDLTEYDGVERLWAAATAGGRVVDAVALNAGVGVGGPFVETDLAAELNVIQLNCASTVHLGKRAAVEMAGRGKGRILVTSSVAARVPSANQAVYAASKAFVHFFALSIAAELESSGVTVTAFMPGPTHSEFFDRAGLEDSALGATDKKDDPAQVAEQAVDALLAGKDHVVAGSLTTKISGVLGNLTPGLAGAKAQGKAAEPGTAG